MVIRDADGIWRQFFENAICNVGEMIFISTIALYVITTMQIINKKYSQLWTEECLKQKFHFFVQ